MCTDLILHCSNIGFMLAWTRSLCTGDTMSLESARSRITEITQLLLRLFAERQSLMQEIAEAKISSGNLAVYDPFREFSLFSVAQKIAEETGTGGSDLELLLSFVMGIAKHSQMKILHVETQFSSSRPKMEELESNLLVLTQKIAHSYEQHSDSLVRKAYIRREQEIMEQTLSNLPQGSKVLHLGCATGVRIAEICSKSKLRLVGIDISPEMIGLANQLFPNHRWIQYNLKNGIPLESGTIDYVVAPLGSASECFSENFLHEILRVMSPDSECFLSFYNQGMLCGHSWNSPWKTDHPVIFNPFNDTILVPYEQTLFELYAKFVSHDLLSGLTGHNLKFVESSSPLWDDKPSIFFENNTAVELVREYEIQTAHTKPFLGKYIRCVLQK